METLLLKGENCSKHISDEGLIFEHFNQSMGGYKLRSLFLFNFTKVLGGLILRECYTRDFTVYLCFYSGELCYEKRFNREDRTKIEEYKNLLIERLFFVGSSKLRPPPIVSTFYLLTL